MQRDEKQTVDDIGRRRILQMAGVGAGSLLLNPSLNLAEVASVESQPESPANGRADYSVRIGTGLVEVAPDQIVSTTMYNGQFPGPLLRFKEGRRITVDIYNDTDTQEQQHWHGQFLPVDVDGSAEEGTPFVPAHR